MDRGMENFNYISLDIQEGWKYTCFIPLCKRLVNLINADFSKYFAICQFLSKLAKSNQRQNQLTNNSTFQKY